ncbi:collagen-like protein [bacterium]|nr:MAG: collagen-like protein [bacterium]
MIEESERDGLLSAVVDYVDDQIANATKEIKSNIKEPQKGEQGPPGINGKDGESVVGPPGSSGKDAEVNYSSIITEVLKQIPSPEDGQDGEDGEDGAPGPQGPEGIPGQSIVGPPGVKGDPGKDAIVDYEKVVVEAVKRIPTPKDGIDGKEGVQGPQGSKGDKGDTGERGLEGAPGVIGAQGPPGINGKDGQAGAPGPQGEKGDPGSRGEKGESIVGPSGPAGIDGRDALQIDILPSVNFDRSYPRGTYARYEGGIIRSYRDTIPGEVLEKAGWEVVIAGISAIDIVQGDDPREFLVKSRMTGGYITERSFRMPAMIYRGIYKQGDAYRQGDVVTWGGSAWHCQIDNPKTSPSESQEWKLMVKEGRKGKDGKDGERGIQGLPGRPGMDARGDI